MPEHFLEEPQHLGNDRYSCRKDIIRKQRVWRGYGPGLRFWGEHWQQRETVGGGSLAFWEGALRAAFGEGSLLTEDVDSIPSEGGLRTSSGEGRLLRGVSPSWDGCVGILYYGIGGAVTSLPVTAGRPWKARILRKNSEMFLKHLSGDQEKRKRPPAEQKEKINEEEDSWMPILAALHQWSFGA